MGKYSAAVLGCGRIGAGLGWSSVPPYLYDHCSAYDALRDQVSLKWVLDPDPRRASMASLRFCVPGYSSGDWRKDLATAMREWPVDLVSICTPPEARSDLINELARYESIRGAWIEKPLAVTSWPEHWKINVGYIRRFDPRHIAIAHGEHVGALWVWAKKDRHTVCHFTDLARFWGLRRDGLHYFQMDGPNSYVAETTSGVKFFPLGGITAGSDFMKRLLGNLLDAVDGLAEIESSAENAIESEKWADEIIRGS